MPNLNPKTCVKSKILHMHPSPPSTHPFPPKKTVPHWREVAQHLRGHCLCWDWHLAADEKWQFQDYFPSSIIRVISIIRINSIINIIDIISIWPLLSFSSWWIVRRLVIKEAETRKEGEEKGWGFPADGGFQYRGLHRKSRRREGISKDPQGDPAFRMPMTN